MTRPAANTYSAPNAPLDLWVRHDTVTVGTGNPRQNFDEAKLRELADSIAEHGLLQPIVVRHLPGIDLDRLRAIGLEFWREGPVLEIVAGERRWRACKLAGYDRIPVRLIEDLDDASALRLAIVENVQREDLDPIEVAEGYRRLEQIGMKQKDIGAAVGKSQPTVANTMRVLDLPTDVQDLVRKGGQAGGITLSHAVAIAAFKDVPGVPSRLAERAVAEGWSSASLEETCQELKKIAKWPALMAACLEQSGATLKRQLSANRWIGNTIPERVKAVLDDHSRKEEKRQLIEKLKGEGKTVVDKVTGNAQRLWDHSEEAAAYEAAGLDCEVWFVDDYNRVVAERYCTDVKALKAAVAKARKDKPLSDGEREYQQRELLKATQIEARNTVISNWARDFQMPAVEDLLMFARRRMDSLVRYEDTPLLNAANWMQVQGKSKSEKIAAVKELVAKGETRGMLLVWLLAELSTVVNGYEPVPDWMKPWLEAQGYVDPAVSEDLARMGIAVVDAGSGPDWKESVA